MNQQEQIIHHLSELFIFLSKKGSSELTKAENFKSISHTSSSWPNFIFDINFNSSSPRELAKAIENEQLPQHIILSESQTEQYEGDLIDNNFFPIAEWACLKLEGQPQKLPPPNSFNIQKISTLEELKQWVKVASSGFSHLDNSVFINCLKSKKIHFYAGFENEKMVTSALLFFHCGAAGIYHVSTLPESRKKGYGTQLFLHCEKEALEQGFDTVIAQSTADGLNAWKNTGMKQYGNFYLLCWNKV